LGYLGPTSWGEISADIQRAAQSVAAIILLMAMCRLEALMDIFASDGNDGAPVAIIQNGTTREEKMISGSVKDFFFKADSENTSNPLLLLVKWRSFILYLL
jgi:uroporphyrin-III C-methyltransferase